MSLVDQHCHSEQELENRILPLEQKCVKKSHINDAETRKNIKEEIIEEENQIYIEKSKKKIFQ